MADYEVELKFRLAGNSASVREQIRGLGATCCGQTRQIDTYFAHPSRDFAVTDEAFRIRQQGEANCLTYKGPLLDTQTKTRQETEVAFADGASAAEQLRGMLESLSFREVARVSKHRETWTLAWESREVYVAFDNVEGLGEFLELEILSTASEWQHARDSALRLSGMLNLSQSERRSYLQLLLESRSQGSPQLPKDGA